jgi:DNA repair protein RecO (recombination protein O)
MIEWQDEAIVLGYKSFGENKRIIFLLTNQYGRVNGLMREPKSSKLQGLAQMGNRVIATWKGRLEEHLGYLSLEVVESFTGRLMGSAAKLLALSSASLLTHSVFPERHPYPAVYEAFLLFLESLKGEKWPETYIHFEHKVLDEMGFGLKLDACCVSGETENLLYVSPKTGRAVSEKAASPYEERLLRLPAFLLDESLQAKDFEDLKNGFILMDHFFKHQMTASSYKKFTQARGQLLRALIKLEKGRNDFIKGTLLSLEEVKRGEVTEYTVEV